MQASVRCTDAESASARDARELRIRMPWAAKQEEPELAARQRAAQQETSERRISKKLALSSATSGSISASFWTAWRSRIHHKDAGIWRQCRNSVHAYIIIKLFHRICEPNPWRTRTSSAWQWLPENRQGPIACAVLWADGTKESQQTIGDRGCEQGWPCIIVDIANEQTLPFYCPALAWQGSKPWDVARDRIHIYPMKLPSLPGLLGFEDAGKFAAIGDGDVRIADGDGDVGAGDRRRLIRIDAGCFLSDMD